MQDFLRAFQITYNGFYNCTKILMYIIVIDNLRESAEISAVRYTILNGIVHEHITIKK